MKKLITLLAVALLTLAAAQDTVTLRIWDTFSDAAQDAGMSAMIEAFEAANPNIVIERDVQTALAPR
jgi:ABC-type glycerol-3-phosphate transport system substrate-binding protein